LFSKDISVLAETVLSAARKKKMKIVTAESCTGGLVSGALTEISGSSDVFDRGFVTYSNDAKMTHIGVSRKTIADFGAVSAETALEMAIGALSASHADIALSVTGVAGPTGGTKAKPVGLVYIGIAFRKGGKSFTIENHFDGNRAEIRMKTVKAALKALKKEVERF
jgi:PncC family amidohydrolase